MLDNLSQMLRDKWHDFSPGAPVPESIRYLGISGSVEGGTTTFLAFAPGRRMPLFAVKVHRSAEAEKRVLREKNILALLEKSPLFTGRVPRTVFSGLSGSCWVIVQTILPGRPMEAPLRKDAVDIAGARRNFRMIDHWFNDITSLAAADDDPAAGDSAESLREDVERFTEVFPLTEEELRLARRIKDNLTALLGPRLRIRHGDFCRQNILIADAQINTAGVIDWTDASFSRVPLNDALFFLTSYYLQNRKATGIAGFTSAFEHTFFDPSPYRDLVTDTLRGICRLCGADTGLIELHLGLFLIEQALFEYGKMSRFSASGLPRFTVYLAAMNGKGYRDAQKEQLWIYFFRTLASRLSKGNRPCEGI